MLVLVQWSILASAAAFSIYGFTNTTFQLISTYLLLWAIFHTAEYTATLWYLPRTLTPYSFLMYGARGSVHLAGVHLATITEHVVTKRVWNTGSFPVWGGFVAFIGITIRFSAIATCGDSFSHYIETLPNSQTESRTQQRSRQKLVTHGVYKWCRHPSYLGFLVYVIGMQLIMGNVLTFVASLAVLWRFFRQRMDIEEWFLVNRIYGQDYVEYMRHTRRLVPWVY